MGVQHEIARKNIREQIKLIAMIMIITIKINYKPVKLQGKSIF